MTETDLFTAAPLTFAIPIIPESPCAKTNSTDSLGQVGCRAPPYVPKSHRRNIYIPRHAWHWGPQKWGIRAAGFLPGARARKGGGRSRTWPGGGDAGFCTPTLATCGSLPSPPLRGQGRAPVLVCGGRDKLERGGLPASAHPAQRGGRVREKERGPGGGVARTGEGGGASETGVGLVGVSPSGRNSQLVGRWQSGKGTGGGSAYQVAGRVSLRLAFSRVESARSRVLGVAGCFASAQGCGSGEGPAAGSELRPPPVARDSPDGGGRGRRGRDRGGRAWPLSPEGASSGRGGPPPRAPVRQGASGGVGRG